MPADVPASNQADRIVPSGSVFHNTFEVWRLPGGERMGVLGSNMLFDVHENFRLCVGTYGALTGNRGGLITLGFAGEARQDLSESWQLNGGVFVGAGDGAGGLELAGGGFMFRATGGLTYRVGRLDNIGVGVSWVTFPTGSIKSVQPYIMYEYPFYTALTKGRPKGNPGPMGGLMAPANRQEFAIRLTGSRFLRRSKIVAGASRTRRCNWLGQSGHPIWTIAGS